MLSYKKISMIFLFFLILVLTGCATHKISTPQKDLPIELANELENISGVNFGFVVLTDSTNGRKIFLKHPDADVYPVTGPEAASEIRNIASVSITAATDVEVQGVKFSSCNYISINGQIELICQKNESVEPRSISDLVVDESILPSELASKLEKISEISNIGFLVLVDIVTGQAKLLKRDNYADLSASFPQSISGIASGSAWNVTTYKKNPCCYWTIIDGDMVYVCKRLMNC